MSSDTSVPASKKIELRSNENTTGNSMRHGRSKLLEFAKMIVIVSLYLREHGWIRIVRS
eukprot:COSAG02_NODE_13_length_57813_cov_14.298276_42_plen_59_part_00